MATINPNTKKAENFRKAARNYDGYTLYDIYGTFSHAKARAYAWCLDTCSYENGYNFHIISHNTFGFSVAWETVDGLRIETPRNSYFIPNA